MANGKKYGQLLTPDIKLHRRWFLEMVKLIGINVLYKAPKSDSKYYTQNAELKATYEDPILVGCIFDEHPTQQTLRKMGWVSELQDGSSLIHVQYDLPKLQQGALFIVPSGLDDGKGRVFRVVRITNSIVYPASVMCEIVPEYINDFNEVTDYNFDPTDMDILADEQVGPTYILDENDLVLANEDNT